MAFISYAQNNEDAMLWRAFHDAGPGFYVDVGAADPDADSVTRAFYDRGWHGVNIEPVPSMARRIADARPRDVTLEIAAGARDGSTILHVVPGTGLSTINSADAARLERDGHDLHPLTVSVRQLSAILDEHAPDTIHFLKIDVEGAEREVLEGCDFKRHRPRVILVEATRPKTTEPAHEGWEPLLLDAGYRFAWFDGLNRFYIADEWVAALSPCFAIPINVFDGVVSVAELHRAGQTEADLRLTQDRARLADAGARAAYSRAFEQARDLGVSRTRLAQVEQDRQHMQARTDDLQARADDLQARADALQARCGGLEGRMAEADRQTIALMGCLAEAERLLDATRRSTSWRVTQPLRAISSIARKGAITPALVVGPVPKAPVPDAPGPETTAQASAALPGPASCEPAAIDGQRHRNRGPLRTVHQFHSGSAVGDAVTNSLLLIRDRLRADGLRSDIFVEHRDPDLSHELRMIADLPPDDRHVLIVHHSMGHGQLDRVLAQTAPKVLYYHNITPPHLLPAGGLRDGAVQGRRQLAQLRDGVVDALAASEYSAIELRRAGFTPVAACPLLFDVDAMLARATDPVWRDPDGPFTVLFVGRIIESKGQADLVDAFALFRSRLGRPARLLLVGRTDSPGDYLTEIDRRMRVHGLEAELIVTGPVSNDELHAQLAGADLYVSLSLHEGFGVPLIEAASYGIPVLAFPSGAVPYTIGAGLLAGRDAATVADAMLLVAQNREYREALLDAQRQALGRFAFRYQWPVLRNALSRAGAAPPTDMAARAALASGMYVTITGHATGTYSLAAVNRGLAEAIDAERPGRARLIPVEGEPITNLSVLSPTARMLAERPAPATGPEVVISQHYPIHLPTHRGDLTLALVFWEESLLPEETINTLAAGFDGVIAPSAFVAKALIDSGLPLPVRVIGNAPDLSAFETIARRRSARELGSVFSFLHVSSCFPRKGVDALLTAYTRAFRRRDRVRLVIKSFPNPHNTIVADVAALRVTDPGMPEIEIIDDDLDFSAMLALYANADAMVLPTRGEGLNLPAAEAMAAGLPLIVTGFGGHMDFCDAQTARLVAYRMAPSRSHLATAQSQWAEPDLADLVDALQELEGSRETLHAMAALTVRTGRARAQVAERLSRRRMIKRLETAALDLLLAPPTETVRVAWATPWNVRCGVAEYTRNLITALPATQGMEHFVLCDTRTGSTGGPMRVRPAWVLGDGDSIAAFESAVVSEDPDVLVIQHQPGLLPWHGLAAWLMSPVLAGRVIVVTLHNTQNLLDTTPAIQAAVSTALRHASRVLVHVSADVERLKRLGLECNVTLLPHGVAASLPRQELRNAGLAPVIGCYGFFLPGKGIAELIRAIALLKKTRPDARLRLVNANYGVAVSDIEIQAAREIAASLGIADAVEWNTAFLADAESLRLLAGCDLIVLPTQASKEASSAAVRTALAAGVPVMVTPLSVYDDVDDAVARTPGITPDLLSVAIEENLSDPARRLELQDAAKCWLISHSWDSIGRRFAGLLAGLVANKCLSGKGMNK